MELPKKNKIMRLFKKNPQEIFKREGDVHLQPIATHPYNQWNFQKIKMIKNLEGKKNPQEIFKCEGDVHLQPITLLRTRTTNEISKKSAFKENPQSFIVRAMFIFGFIMVALCCCYDSFVACLFWELSFFVFLF